MWYIIGAVFVFSLLIITHELGHFTLAKLNGVKVEEFAIGMGPKVFSIKGKETVYMLKAFPIGGYVKMLGEEDECKDPRAFSEKSAIRRLSIILAGPIMNLILPVIIFVCVAYIQGFPTTKLASVVDNYPAAQSGIQKGDIITSINNNKIITWDDVITNLYLNKDDNLSVVVDRNGESKSFNVKPIKDEERGQYLLGIVSDYNKKPSIGKAVNYGFKQTGSLINQMVESIKGIFKGKVSKDDIGGPVTIIRMSGEVAKHGLISLLTFSAFLSINLAIMNLLPFPALDGGWTILLLFEIITGRKPNEKFVGIINYAGFILLMVLMVVIAVKDIFFPVQF